jgi:hypothetical protein
MVWVFATVAYKRVGSFMFFERGHSTDVFAVHTYTYPNHKHTRIHTHTRYMGDLNFDVNLTSEESINELVTNLVSAAKKSQEHGTAGVVTITPFMQGMEGLKLKNDQIGAGRPATKEKSNEIIQPFENTIKTIHRLLCTDEGDVDVSVKQVFEFGIEEGVFFEVTNLVRRETVAVESDDGDYIFVEFPFTLKIEHDSDIVKHVEIVDSNVHGQIRVRMEQGYRNGEAVIKAKVAVMLNSDQDYIVNHDELILKEAQDDAEAQRRKFYEQLSHVVELCFKNRQRTLEEYYPSIIKHMGKYYSKRIPTNEEGKLLLRAFTSFPISFNPKMPCCFEVVCKDDELFEDAPSSFRTDGVGCVTINFKVTPSSLVIFSMSRGTKVSRVLLCHAVPLLFKERKHFQKFKSVQQLAGFLAVSEGISSKNATEIKKLAAKNQEYENDFMGMMEKQKKLLEDSCLYLDMRINEINQKIQSLDAEMKAVAATVSLNKENRSLKRKAIKKKKRRLTGLLEKTTADKKTAMDQQNTLCGEDKRAATTLMQKIKDQVCKKNTIQIEALQAQIAAFINKRNAILSADKLNELHTVFYKILEYVK